MPPIFPRSERERIVSFVIGKLFASGIIDLFVAITERKKVSSHVASS